MKKLGIFLSLIFSLKLLARGLQLRSKKFCCWASKWCYRKIIKHKLKQRRKGSFVEEIALNNVDIKALGLYTLGELRKSLDKKDIENYQQTFKSYFLKSLTSRLSDYSSSKFEVIEAEQKSSTYTIIKSKILQTDGNPEIKIDWRIYTKNPEKPLIRDLIVEGLSLARTQKEEFSSILNSNNNDINILIIKLQEFVNNWLVGPPGLEPGTNTLWVYCSTNWATGPLINHGFISLKNLSSFNVSILFLFIFLLNH